MRIRTDGDRSHRTATIKAAADTWGCNKTKAMLKSADLARRIRPALVEVLERDDLTRRQRREIAETLSIAGTIEVSIDEDVDVELE